MLAAKGKSSPDGTYLYACGKCAGRNPQCDWCFGGDFNKVRSALKGEYLGITPRGQMYYSLLKEFLRIAGKPMVETAHQMKPLKAADIGYISLYFGLNFKATWEWLQECYVLKYPYSRVGFKVSEAYELAREKYGEIAEWQPN